MASLGQCLHASRFPRAAHRLGGEEPCFKGTGVPLVTMP